MHRSAIREVTIVIRTVLFAALIAAGSTAAAATDISGHYRMEGVSPTGSAYSGKADIVMSFENTCRINYSDGSAGICMMNRNNVTAAYLVHGKLGLVIYEIRSDGTLEGILIDDFHGGRFGKEKLIPIR
jgi:hypothetical protein